VRRVGLRCIATVHGLLEESMHAAVETPSELFQHLKNDFDALDASAEHLQGVVGLTPTPPKLLANIFHSEYYQGGTAGIIIAV
jgi:hypothetical protein